MNWQRGHRGYGLWHDEERVGYVGRQQGRWTSDYSWESDVTKASGTTTSLKAAKLLVELEFQKGREKWDADKEYRRLAWK